MDFVIIGNGAAGLSCLETLRFYDYDKESSITLISDEKYPAYSRVLLSYYIADEINKEDLFLYKQERYKKLNIKTVFGKKVVRILPLSSAVELDDNSVVKFDKLLIATGSSPKFPKISGINLEGVFALRNLDDARFIRDMAKNVKDVVIVGGGLVSIKTGCALRKLGKNVTFVISSNQVLSQTFDLKASVILKKHLEGHNVRIILHEDVEEIIGGKKGVEGVNLRSGLNLKCQMVIIGKGVNSNVDSVKETNIHTDRGIIVNNFMQTNVENIYAAGDVAQAENYLTGRKEVMAIWPAAVEQGKVAALNMLGKTTKHLGSIRMNVVDVFGLCAVAIGEVRDGDSKNTINLGNNREIFIKNNIPIGYVCVNNIDHAGIMYSLIKSKRALSNDLISLFSNCGIRYDKYLFYVNSKLF